MSAVLLGLLVLACAAAAALEAKCLRDPCIPDNALSLAGRRIKIAGYMILALRSSVLLVESHEVFLPSAIALLLVAFSDCIRCANRLQLPRSVMIGTGQ